MSEKHNSSNNMSDSSSLERGYFIASIVGVVFAAIFGFLNLYLDFFQADSESPSADNGSTVASATIEGDDNTVSNAAAAGEGSMAVNKVAGGNYYDYSSVGSAPQENLLEIEYFKDHESRLAYSADLIERGKDSMALKFLMEYLQMEGLDEQTEATIQYNCGVCCLHLEDYHQAIIYLNYAAEKTQSPYAYYNLACAYMGRKDYSNAVEGFETAVELSRKPDSTVTPEEYLIFCAALENVEQPRS